jgi:hypothetical protein
MPEFNTLLVFLPALPLFFFPESKLLPTPIPDDLFPKTPPGSEPIRHLGLLAKSLLAHLLRFNPCFFNFLPAPADRVAGPYVLITACPQGAKPETGSGDVPEAP